MRAPAFWNNKNSISTVLTPLSGIYRRCAEHKRNAVTPFKLPVTVICIGNAVAGGAGKTPTALAVGAMLKAQGVAAHFLTRGYKGKLAGPVQVDPNVHTAVDVGDEALLLAEILPTWVAHDRVAGGKAAAKAGAEFIVMDDGYQNPSLHKNIHLLVIDGAYGFGNECLLPAGPLREPAQEAVARANAVVIFGEDKKNVLRYVSPYVPLIHADLKPVYTVDFLRGKSVVAFAGIGRPAKFYQTLVDLGCNVIQMVPFPDHHNFTARDLGTLKTLAKKHDALLVTTKKDYVRLPVQMRIEVLPIQVEAQFQEPDAVWRLLFP